jgi:hypothetical protein
MSLCSPPSQGVEQDKDQGDECGFVGSSYGKGGGRGQVAATPYDASAVHTPDRATEQGALFTKGAVLPGETR